jgi:HAD domain in Swiss Army Knife RNA repair proteins
MRVLFLDIDAVLIGARAMELLPNRAAKGIWADDPPPRFDVEAVNALNQIVLRSGATIVIASSWAVIGRERTERLLADNDVAAALHEDWRTRSFPSFDRRIEILDWLDSHQQIREWTAIGEDLSIGALGKGYLVKDPDGLVQADVAPILSLVGEGDEPEPLTGVPRKREEYTDRWVAIIRRYPWASHYVLSCPTGWLELLEEALARAERHVHRDDLPALRLRRLDVFRGALRLEASDAAASRQLWRAERRSAEICCVCGRPGSCRIDRAGWLALCADCHMLDDSALAARMWPVSRVML